MKINNQSNIAIKAMISLAEAFGDNPISLSELSKRQDRSQAYFEQLFAKLKKSGLVSSVRGPGGGFELARTDVSILDIIISINGNLNISETNQDNATRIWREICDKTYQDLADVKILDRAFYQPRIGPIQ